MHVDSVNGRFPPVNWDGRAGPACKCGHSYAAHQHYRSGSECSLCSDCPRYRPALGLLARAIEKLTRRAGTR
jgi:hypothetical protein